MSHSSAQLQIPANSRKFAKCPRSAPGIYASCKAKPERNSENCEMSKILGNSVRHARKKVQKKARDICEISMRISRKMAQHARQGSSQEVGRHILQSLAVSHPSDSYTFLASQLHN